MFDRNQFKKVVKEWMKTNETGSSEELRSFCEEQIPSNEYQAYRWMIEETLSWYDSILLHRKALQNIASLSAEEQAEYLAS